MERKDRILIVDDDSEIRQLLVDYLARNGFDAVPAASGREMWQLLDRHAVDLVVLDLMLPGISGIEVARIFKSDPRTRKIPIIMLTARGEEADVVAGLALADDYVTKPFSPKILGARISAMLRRNSEAPEEKDILRRGDISIDPGRRKVEVRGEPVELPFSEFQILMMLSRRPGWVFTRSQIVDAVRGDSYSVTERSVDVQIAGLRKKLGPCGHYIETVRSVGYRFKEIP